MAKYTTGEVAKLCGVSVRTVQYYDTRNIIVPGELSEGGRRLYSEDDLRRMKTACFLREAGVPLSSIGELMRDEEPEKVISVILDRQEETLRSEISERQKQLDTVNDIKKQLRQLPSFSLESINDIAHVVKNNAKLGKLRMFLLVTGIPLNIFQFISIILWITEGIWWLFAVWFIVAAVYGSIISAVYFKKVGYICPECHSVFRPAFCEALFADHTPTLRKLTCKACGHRGFCVETYVNTKENSNNG